SWPIFIVLLSTVILKERLNLRRGLSILLGFSGVALVLTKGSFAQVRLDNYLVDGLVLVAAFVFGLFSVLSKKIRLEQYTLLTIYFLTATVAALISMLLLSQFAWPIKNALLLILVNGLFVNGFSYIFWIKALKAAEASFVAPFVFLTPVLAAVYLIVFFQESLLPVYGIGLATVVVAGLLNR
ncbi:permease, partial [Candidatus Beckwithbacteria bacterium CG22_combo_CG10-13_8_21_14_all_01_47_9]